MGASRMLVSHSFLIWGLATLILKTGFYFIDNPLIICVFCMYIILQ